MQCDVCHLPATAYCEACKRVTYCSKTCQQKDWNATHAETCHLIEQMSLGVGLTLKQKKDSYYVGTINVTLHKEKSFIFDVYLHGKKEVKEDYDLTYGEKKISLYMIMSLEKYTETIRANEINQLLDEAEVLIKTIFMSPEKYEELIDKTKPKPKPTPKPKPKAVAPTFVVAPTPLKQSKLKSNLSINFTGVRDGETLIGVDGEKQSAGVEMEIRATSMYHPINASEDNVVRDRFKQIEFFSGMTFAERKEWLALNTYSYTSNKENHLHDAQNDLSVRFIKIENAHFLKALGPEVIADLLTRDEYMPMTEVYELFRPINSTSKPNRFSLVLRPEIWQIKLTEKKVDTYEGGIIIRMDYKSDQLVIDASKKKVIINTTDETLFPLTTGKAAIIYTTTHPPLLVERELIELTSSFLSKSEYQECADIALLIKSFDASLLKSLLQKIVRTRCDYITHENRDYSARPFLLVVFIRLMLHPGSFNVNKRRFVTGLESALKRLAVIICEDSFIEDTSALTLLLTGAFVRQRDRKWIPSLIQIKRYFKTAVDARDSLTMLDYKTHKKYTFSIVGVPNAYQLNAMIIESIGSLTGDINFFSYLAKKKIVTRDYPRNNVFIKMPLIHCIDQHSYTAIAHFTVFDEETPMNRVAPFKALFQRVWNEVGSVNGRRDYDRITTMENDDFVKEIRFAQHCIERRLFSVVKETKIVTNDFFDFTHSIDESWLSGFIGPIIIKTGAIETIVILRTDDIMDMITTRNPKSDRSVGANDMLVALTDEERERSLEAARVLLRKGYKIKNVPDALSQFKGAIVRLVDVDVENELQKKYVIKFADRTEEIDWSEAIKLKAKFPLFDYEGGDGRTESFATWIEIALREKSDGVARDASDILDAILDRYPLSVIRRLYMYLANFRPEIKLYDISREGKASKLEVSLLDIGVNHILYAICALYPACLESGSAFFRVKYGPLLWSVRDIIKKRIDDAIIEVDSDSAEEDGDGKTSWKNIPGDDTKPLFQHQQQCLDEMIERNKKNKKGQQLVLAVGMGKTAVFVMYIAYLIAAHRMQKYCVYTCPPEAIVNAKREFDRLGVPYVDMVTRQKNKNLIFEPLVPYCINIVAHDHMTLDKIAVQMREYAGEINFIIDEYHKTINSKTKRTSIALEIARMSAEFVACTGTLIREDKPGDLIEWLEQIVEFFVNKDNYLVAFGGLITRKADTGIIVKKEYIDCAFTPKEEAEYNSKVPARLGGTSLTLDYRAALRLCYQATDREMVRLILHYVIEEEEELVVVLTENTEHQRRIRDEIVKKSRGVIASEDIFLIEGANSITLKPEDETRIRIVITTLHKVTGFTLTKSRISITSVYASNEATRSQFEGRTNRPGQLSNEIKIVTLHAGILSYLMVKYERVRSLAHALRQLAQEVGVDYNEMIAQ